MEPPFALPDLLVMTQCASNSVVRCQTPSQTASQFALRPSCFYVAVT